MIRDIKVKKLSLENSVLIKNSSLFILHREPKKVILYFAFQVFFCLSLQVSWTL